LLFGAAGRGINTLFIIRRYAGGMLRLILAGLLLILVPPALAAPTPPQPVAPGLLCRQAIAAAERTHAIPGQLLAAIARVESGRRDPVSGAMHPWPWTVNAEGQGYVFDTKAEAVAAVQAMRARGIRSIDVGCMQVNLMHHPDAFAGLEQAFDPVANATYAARFLTQLFAQSGAWPKAAALYHSATPELGAEYQRKVLAAWPEEQRHAQTMAPLATAWAATLPRTGSPPFRRSEGGRIIPLAAAPGGSPSGGRGLDSYRATPVLLAYRPPRPNGG
jgi:hypothetical protein